MFPEPYNTTCDPIPWRGCPPGPSLAGLVSGCCDGRGYSAISLISSGPPGPSTHRKHSMNRAHYCLFPTNPNPCLLYPTLLPPPGGLIERELALQTGLQREQVSASPRGRWQTRVKRVHDPTHACSGGGRYVWDHSPCLLFADCIFPVSESGCCIKECLQKTATAASKTERSSEE